MALQPGFRLNKQYGIERVLGAGGFGVTYVGRDFYHDRRVAIKENFPRFLVQRDAAGRVLLTGDARTYRWVMRHFVTEAHFLSNLNHPNIVRGYGIVESNNTAYFIMEYVQGKSLETYRFPSEWTEPTLRRILRPLLDALLYLQQNGIAHRDIKPANIMVRDNGEPVLIDFGAAKSQPSNCSMSMPIVTLGFSPPEQVADYDCIDPSIDVYALGATMYNLITGTIPDIVTARMKNPNYDTYTPLSTDPHLLSRFSENFLLLIDRALILDAGSRLTAEEWLMGLQSNTQPSPVIRSVGVSRRLSRWFSSLGRALQPAPRLQPSRTPAPRTPAPRPVQRKAAYSDDSDEIPLDVLLRWGGIICYSLGGLLMAGIVLSLFTSGSAGGSLDSFFPLAVSCIFAGVLCSIILNFTDFPDD